MSPAAQMSPPASRPPSGSGAPPNDVGVAAREAALALVQAGLARRGGFDEALAQPSLAALPVRERAFARALAATTFRRLGPVDRLLAAKLTRQPPEIVRDLLRLGAVQLLFMDTPPHAAVSTAMALAQSRNDLRPFKGLINAVLRGLDRERSPEPSPPDPEALAPAWLFARWRAAYGDAVARAIAARILEEPPTDLTLRDPADADALVEALPGERLPGGGLRTWRRGDLAEWPGFTEGRWWVQDLSAALPARLLAVRPGETALDLCAAPGGKTLQLAAAGARVTAVDRSAPRLVRLSENLARMGLAAETVVADAGRWAAQLGAASAEGPDRRYDAVLLDAPCTATGTFRRHPDVLWAARPGDVAKLVELQARLLDAAAAAVRPGGRLVYCVCSLELEEGEAQTTAFLARHGDEFEPAPMAPEAADLPADAAAAHGALRLHPGLEVPGGLDGFYIARFTRRI